jgi:hypothetical protein
MGNNLKQKLVNNFVEFWNDTRIARGKPPANRELRRYLKAKTGSKVWDTFSNSPTEVQFFTHYKEIPVELRKKNLETTSLIIMATLHNQVLRLVYRTIWQISEGINLVEIKEWLEKSVGQEISEVVFQELAKHPGINGVIKFGTDTLGLTPGTIAGANTRLKDILRRRSIKQNESKSEFEQDLSIGLWECSEGAHLDEFEKRLSRNGDFTEMVTSLRQIFQDKDNQALRGIFVKILRKTIEDLPDVADAVSDQRSKKESGLSIIRDESDTNDDEPFFDNIADKNAQSMEEYYEQQEQLEEWRSKTHEFTSRELELYQNELRRLTSDQTREEFYGNFERAKSVTQQLKYINREYSG